MIDLHHARILAAMRGILPQTFVRFLAIFYTHRGADVGAEHPKACLNINLTLFRGRPPLTDLMTNARLHWLAGGAAQMRTKSILSLIFLGILFFVSGPVFAHHGSAAYDMSKTVTVTGTITDFQFVNPHVLIAMDVKDPSGKVDKWQGELTSPNHLARAGWTKSTLKPGDQITLIGGPAKSGSPTMWIRKITKDGQEVSLGGGGDN